MFSRNEGWVVSILDLAEHPGCKQVKSKYAVCDEGGNYLTALSMQYMKTAKWNTLKELNLSMLCLRLGGMTIGDMGIKRLTGIELPLLKSIVLCTDR